MLILILSKCAAIIYCNQFVKNRSRKIAPIFTSNGILRCALCDVFFSSYQSSNNKCLHTRESPATFLMERNNLLEIYGIHIYAWWNTNIIIKRPSRCCLFFLPASFCLGARRLIIDMSSARRSSPGIQRIKRFGLHDCLLDDHIMCTHSHPTEFSILDPNTYSLSRLRFPRIEERSPPINS